jgi:hypothetical protein
VRDIDDGCRRIQGQDDALHLRNVRTPWSEISR